MPSRVVERQAGVAVEVVAVGAVCRRLVVGVGHPVAVGAGKSPVQSRSSSPPGCVSPANTP